MRSSCRCEIHTRIMWTDIGVEMWSTHTCETDMGVKYCEVYTNVSRYGCEINTTVRFMVNFENLTV